MELLRNAGSEIQDCAMALCADPWLHPGYSALGVQTCE